MVFRLFYGQNRCFFIDGQKGGDGLQEFEGMKPGLVGEIDGSFYGKGQLGISGKLGMNSGLHGSPGFLPQYRGIFQGIQARGAFFEIAEDGSGVNQALVFQNGFLIGRGVKSCTADAHVFLKLLIDKPMLGGDFGSGALCLAAADSVCFQDDDLLSGLGEIVGGEDSRQTGADDGYVCCQIAWKAVAGRDGCGLGPDSFHSCSPRNSYCQPDYRPPGSSCFGKILSFMCNAVVGCADWGRIMREF